MRTGPIASEKHANLVAAEAHRGHIPAANSFPKPPPLVLSSRGARARLPRGPRISVPRCPRKVCGVDSSASIDAPRSNRDPGEIERKLSLLHLPHVAPLTAYVDQLRVSHPEALVPYFDPTEAGVEATILGLFEAPGPKAAPPVGSGFVSADNNDQTAQNVWTLLQAAEVDRCTEYVAWNVVPWYLGDGTRIRAASGRDLIEARDALEVLLSLLPDVRVAIVFGKAAAQAWKQIGPKIDAIEAPHPSPLNVNTRPLVRSQILAALEEARRRAAAPR